MGARFGTECYADAAAAASAQCSATAGVTSAGFLRCTAVGGTPDAPLLFLTLTPPDGAPTVSEVAFAGQACDPFEGYADLMEMWGLALVALVGLWCVKNFVLKLVMPT